MKIGYIALCLIVPLLWGLASARLFDWWQSRSGPAAASHDSREQDDQDMSGHMYHI